jgi:hypothetical protein
LGSRQQKSSDAEGAGNVQSSVQAVLAAAAAASSIGGASRLPVVKQLLRSINQEKSTGEQPMTIRNQFRLIVPAILTALAAAVVSANASRSPKAFSNRYEPEDFSREPETCVRTSHWPELKFLGTSCYIGSQGQTVNTEAPPASAIQGEAWWPNSSEAITDNHEHSRSFYELSQEQIHLAYGQ